MEGYGEMTYTDLSVYSGWWHLGRRHGHGRMEYTLKRCTYTGAWDKDARWGYGVYDNQPGWVVVSMGVCILSPGDYDAVYVCEVERGTWACGRVISITELGY